MNQPIRQRRKNDCMVCCLAMLLEIPYEEAEQYFPPAVVKSDSGYSWQGVVDAVNATYKKTSLEITDTVSHVNPAVLCIPTPDGSWGRHCVYWDGVNIWDPALKRSFRNIPPVVYQVIQIEH